MAKNHYDEVTNRILAQLEAGTPPWIKEWKSIGRGNIPKNAVTKRPYSGGNVILLWAHGYATQRWLTFKQAVRRVSRMKGVTHGSLSSVQLCRRFSHAGPVTARCEAGMKAQGDFQPSEETGQGEGRKGEANEPSVRRVVRNECRNVG